jgi:hypothetical protein
MGFLDFDLNKNGVPDLREGWLYRIGVRIAAFAIRRHASPHTLARRYVDQAEDLANEVLTATVDGELP